MVVFIGVNPPACVLPLIIIVIIIIVIMSPALNAHQPTFYFLSSNLFLLSSQFKSTKLSCKYDSQFIHPFLRPSFTINSPNLNLMYFFLIKSRPSPWCKNVKQCNNLVMSYKIFLFLFIDQRTKKEKIKQILINAKYDLKLL